MHWLMIYFKILRLDCDLYYFCMYIFVSNAQIVFLNQNTTLADDDPSFLPYLTYVIKSQSS